MANFCAHCGKPVTKEMNFCANCGSKIIHNHEENNSVAKGAAALTGAAVLANAANTSAQSNNSDIDIINKFFGFDTLGLENFTGQSDVDIIAEVAETFDIEIGEVADYAEDAADIIDAADFIDDSSFEIIGGFLGF